MPKLTATLTAKAVDALRDDGRYRVGGVPGLMLRVAGGYRGWIVRVRIDGQRRDLTLGDYPALSVAQAREIASNIHLGLKRGEKPLSPIEQRKQLETERRKQKTFKQCAEAYIVEKSPEWKNAKHKQQWASTLEQYAYPVLGGLPVGEVGLAEVLAVLKPIWQEKTETASRLRGRIEKILSWATVHGLRTGDNPARWRGHLDQALLSQGKIAPVQHHEAVPYAEMPQFMQTLKRRKGMAATALELLILTATRSNEVRGARWDELDLEAGLWAIPADRMKSSKAHTIPLSRQAIELLQSIPQIDASPLVFPGRGSKKALSDMTLTAVMRRMGLTAVPHGFRSSFRDWAGDKTEHQREVIENALSHTLKNATEAAYRRSTALEKRRIVMQEWADYVYSGQNRENT